jgi:hypothetical protein
MQYYDSFAKQVIFNNQFGNPIAGVPLRTCVNNDRQMSGGSLDIDPNDELNRFDGLIVPTGLYMHSCADAPSMKFKKTECKTIPDNLFEKLLTDVVKLPKYSNSSNTRNKRSTNGKYTRRK